jgi:hypothetical protein
MADNASPFDAAYGGATSTTSTPAKDTSPNEDAAPRATSTTSTPAKDTSPNEDAAPDFSLLYGSAKPRRIVIRAKITND